MTTGPQHTRERAARVRSSMLWGAWADALGFISEMTTAANLDRRTRGRPLTKPFSWSRQVGGRNGVRADFPAGTYSDDTQLRLSTSRAISSHGFDVEAFAKVELSVWPSYALGGGRASRAAAASIGRQQSTWATNFFDGWQNSGGNGAAMRIQPHVYAAAKLAAGHYLDDVICNAVTTHGHPRGITGAVLHAASLAFTLENGRIPDSNNDWADLLATVASSITAFERVPELKAYWLPRWEATTKSDFHTAWYATINELDDMLTTVEHIPTLLRQHPDDTQHTTAAYNQLIDSLKLTAPENRGSATATTIAALALAAGLPTNPAQAAQTAASILDTDTDTIGTMTCSLVGAATPCALPSPVQDENYLISEAERLTQISLGRAVPVFPYPDLLKWKAPRSALDCVGLVNGQPTLAGLGQLLPLRDDHETEFPTRNAVWRWVSTSFGPSMFIKARRDMRDLPPENTAIAATATATATATAISKPLADAEQLPLQEEAAKHLENSSPPRPLELHDVTGWVKKRNFSDYSLGYALRRVIQKGTPDQLEDLVDFIHEELKRIER